MVPNTGLYLRSLGVLCGAMLSIGAAKADDISIGVNMPLTGPFAASGNYVANGAQIAVDEINASGGVLGKKLHLIVEDNKSNPTEAASVEEKLIARDKVPVLLGAWGSSLTLAAIPKLKEYKVPMVVETAGADKITQSGNPYVFRIAATQAIEAEGFETKLNDFNIKKADFIAINNDWGRNTVSEMSKMFKKHDIKVGQVSMVDQAAQDLSAELSQIKNTDADTLIITADVEQLTLILKQAESLGLHKQIITTGGSQSPDQLVQQAGKAADNTVHLVFFAPWEPEQTAFPEKTKAFIKAWKDKGYNFAGMTESFRGYDGIQVIAAAIKKAGVAEPEAIRKALWDVKVDGLNGPVAFLKEGPAGAESGQSTTRVYFCKISDGKISVLK